MIIEEEKLVNGKKMSDMNKKKILNTPPSSAKTKRITQYFEKKKALSEEEEEEEQRECEEEGKEEKETTVKEDAATTNNSKEKLQEDSAQVKTTFGSISKKKFKDNIMKFKEMSRGIECLIRSGFCTSHNCKVVRKVTKKKMSVIGSEGKLDWKMCEVTILACPMKQIPGQPRVTNKQVLSVSEESGGTNNKRRKLEDIVRNQPQDNNLVDQVKENLLLEETK